MASIPTMALHTMAHVSGDDVLSTVHPFPILTMALHTMAHVSRDDVLSTVHLSQVRHQLAAHLAARARDKEYLPLLSWHARRGRPLAVTPPGKHITTRQVAHGVNLAAVHAGRLADDLLD